MVGGLLPFALPEHCLPWPSCHGDPHFLSCCSLSPLPPLRLLSLPFSNHASSSSCCPAAEVNSILSDTMGILQQFLAASTAAAVNGGGGAHSALGSGNAFAEQQQQQQPADPFQ